MKNLLTEIDILQEPHPQPFASQNLDVQFLKNFLANTEIAKVILFYQIKNTIQIL